MAGIVVNFSMMYSLGAMNWLRLIIWLVIGQIIYFAHSRRHSHLQQAQINVEPIEGIQPGSS
jgi:APA family basic amino acid/polyamine antiporter